MACMIERRRECEIESDKVQKRAGSSDDHKGMDMTSERPGREGWGWTDAQVFVLERLNRSAVLPSWPYTSL